MRDSVCHNAFLETLVTFELTIFLLFFTPLSLLNFFCLIYFYSCKKVGGRGLKPPSPSLCAVPVPRYNDLIPLLLWQIVVSGFHCIRSQLHELNTLRSDKHASSEKYTVCISD